MTGVFVLRNGLAGSGLFKPQSPCDKEPESVLIAAVVGCTVVAVSDRKTTSAVGLAGGKGTAVGRAKSFEFRKRFAAGDSRAEVIAGAIERRNVDGIVNENNVMSIRIGAGRSRDDCKQKSWGGVYRPFTQNAFAKHLDDRISLAMIASIHEFMPTGTDLSLSLSPSLLQYNCAVI